MPYDYSTLIGARTTPGSIKFWIKHDAIDPVQVLTEAEAWIYREVRSRHFQTSIEITIDAGESTFALPSNFISPVYLRLHGDSRDLPMVHENILQRFRYEDGSLPTGRPSEWSILNEDIIFDVELDEEIVGIFAYRGSLDPLGTGNETNILTTKFPTLLRNICTSIGYHHREDMEAADKHGAYAASERDRLNVAEEEYRHTMVMRR